MKVVIDENSGYCFGVEFAIKMAEDELDESKSLYCLGDIVHNDMEVERLKSKGLKTISREELGELRNCKVLIRAHGEPPETYRTALENNIELIDASCPVVLKLQNRVKHAYDLSVEKQGQIVIYGKKGHAEVVGLTGQTRENAIVVTTDEDLDKIDFSQPITLFSQTTKSTSGFYSLKKKIMERIELENGSTELVERGSTEFVEGGSIEPAGTGTIEQTDFKANDSICRQVSNREPNLLRFSSTHNVILFVSGKKSSNGRALYSVCKNNNERSYFIENEKDINPKWFNSQDSVGICGATSTPMWLMERVQKFVKEFMKP